MLTINVVKQNNVIRSMEYIGHAEYDDMGRDVVCASASVALLTTVNACLEFDENSIKYREGKIVKLENLKHDNITNKLLYNLECVLGELERQYPNNIKITQKEE